MQWPHSGVSPSSACLGWAQHNKTADKKGLNFNVISNSENIHIPSCNQICTLMQLHYFSLCFMSPTQDFSLVFHWNVHVLGHIKSIQGRLTGWQWCHRGSRLTLFLAYTFCCTLYNGINGSALKWVTYKIKSIMDFHKVQYSINLHCYDDDSQLYVSMEPYQADQPLKFQACLKHILYLCSLAGCITLAPSASVLNLAVLFDRGYIFWHPHFKFCLQSPAQHCKC